MEAKLQFVEGKTATNVDDKFTVEDKFLRGQARQRDNDVREVARERLARFRLQINLLPSAKRQAAETVPFRFILPTVSRWNFFDRLRFHWRQRRREHD